MAELNKVVSLLGIAKKAGKVIAGTEMAVESVRSRKKDAVKLFILACDASANTVKRIENTSAYYKIPVIRLEADKSELARIIGRHSEVSALGVTDQGFTDAMLKAVSQ